ncbi:MAG: aldehyde dehydrogenase family protein, partial [Mycobacterium sp.]|nr:aldehyde dehydrogenase family protein [Mycobacterium sp.]
MNNAPKFYIDGAWVDPFGTRTLDVINPATEQPITTIALGGEKDVERAVAAARRAFESYSQSSREERIDLLERIVDAYERRREELVSAVSQEMGSPVGLSRAAQVPSGVGHFRATLEALRNFVFEEAIGTTTTVVYEPVGVCALITPWNWPLNQIGAKVAAALAAGCTMVLKPSELAPLNAMIFTEILAEAGVPAGVFNLVNGDGPTVGTALATHPGVDMVSFTGSTRAGIEVAKNAAPTVKRVTQELGGKSANIVLDDADFTEVITRDVRGLVVNSGQSCNAGSRILVPADRMQQVVGIAKKAAEAIIVGPPDADDTTVGPVVSQQQFDKVQRLIQSGIDEGATLVLGGLGRPAGLTTGYYVQPTI